jgi:hypothetical protein
MRLWLEDELSCMKASITADDMLIDDSPKAAMIKLAMRKEERIKTLANRTTDLVTAWREAKAADIGHVTYCIQRARRNESFWTAMQEIVVAMIEPYPADMPDGPDPDEFIQQYGAEAFRKLVERPMPWFVFRAASRDTLGHWDKGMDIVSAGIEMHDGWQRQRDIDDFFGYFFGSTPVRTNAA